MPSSEISKRDPVSRIVVPQQSPQHDIRNNPRVLDKEGRPGPDPFLLAFITFLGTNQESISPQMGGLSQYDRQIIDLMFKEGQKQNIQPGWETLVKDLVNSKIVKSEFSVDRNSLFDKSKRIETDISIIWDYSIQQPLNISIEGSFGGVSRSGLSFLFYPEQPQSLDEVLLPVSYPHLLQEKGVKVSYGPNGQINYENEKRQYYFKPLDTRLLHNDSNYFVYGCRVPTANQLHLSRPRGRGPGVHIQKREPVRLSF